MQDDINVTQITPSFIENVLNINPQGKDELRKIDLLEYNIFKMQDLTLNNELVVTTSYILAKQNIFQKLNLSFEVFLTFMTKIQRGYKDVTYHNKVHAADLSQTFNYFCTSCDMAQMT